MKKQASWPRVIKFHGKRFQVRVVSEETLRKDHGGKAPLADFDRDTKTIRIWRDLEHEARWTNLLHEILHLSMRIAHGREPGINDDLEEALIEKTTETLYEILSSNFNFGYKEVRKVSRSIVFGTLKGYNFDLINPDENMVDIEEIAHALAFQCRYNGHIPGNKFLSVAEHSVEVCERIQREAEYGSTVNVPLVALLHDAHETYTGDNSTPFKKLIPEIVEAEKVIQDVIYKKFGLEVSDKVACVVKTADDKIKELEIINHELLREDTKYESGREYLEPLIAEKRFMKKFRSIYHAKS